MFIVGERLHQVIVSAKTLIVPTTLAILTLGLHQLHSQILINGFLSDKLYLLDNLNDELEFNSDYFVCVCVCVNMCMDCLVMLWRMRERHINKNRICRIVRDELLQDLDKVEYPICEPCQSRKMVKKPFSKGTIIHSDIRGTIESTK